MGRRMNEILQSLTGSRRFVALVAIAILGVFREKLGITQELFDVISQSVLVWVGAETLRSSRDGSGIVKSYGESLRSSEKPSAAKS